MAIWASSAYATNVAALAFNHVIPGVTSIVRKKNGFLYHILGKKEKGSLPFGGPKFERLSVISGVKHEITLRGVIPTISTVDDGASGETSLATFNYAANTYGAAEFALSHYADNQLIPESEWDRIKKGDAKQMDNFVKLKSEALMEGWEQTIGVAINSKDAQARTTLGGWCTAISDGQNASSYDESATAYKVYGTIDRSDSGNANFRAYVNRGTGTLTFKKIADVRNQLIIAGGMPSLGLANATEYGLVEQLVQGQAIITNSADMQEFGGAWFSYNGIKFVLDKHVLPDVGATNGQIALITPESWYFVMSDDGFNVEVNAPKDARFIQASGFIHLKAWCGLICRAPSHQGKLVGITG